MRSEDFELTADQVLQCNVGMGLFERGTGWTVLAVVAQDESGVFVSLRPGHKREIAEFLYDQNWNKVMAEALSQSDEVH